MPIALPFGAEIGGDWLGTRGDRLGHPEESATRDPELTRLRVILSGAKDPELLRSSPAEFGIPRYRSG